MRNQGIVRLTCAVLATVLVACATTSDRREHVRGLLAAQTLAEAERFLAPQYRLWFDRRSGEGIARDAAVRMLTWDYALHVTHRVDDIRVEGNDIVAEVHEENDFSRLLGFPGWDSTSHYLLDDEGRVVEQIYVPRPGQTDWRPYLDAPLQWIRQHRPDALPRIYRDERLVSSPEAAREWVIVLKEWRAASRLSDPLRHR